MGEGPDRRGFLSWAAAAAGGVALSPSPSESRTISQELPWRPRQSDAPHPIEGSTLQFFTSEEFNFVEAASERLIPADDHGPGAKDCDVALFIDHQLAGAYGRAEKWYMHGPWPKGQKTQGYQTRLAPAALYRAAIKEIAAHVGSAEQGKAFPDLPADRQDAILTQIENGKIKSEKVDLAAFFKLLLMNTKEGMFSDPIYGGNKNMAGWKMLGFPGARYDYRDWVSKHGQRCDLPPVGLKGRPGWTVKS